MEYAVWGSTIFRGESIFNGIKLEYVNLKQHTWKEVSDEMYESGRYPTIIDKVSESKALEKAIEIGVSKEEFYRVTALYE